MHMPFLATCAFKVFQLHSEHCNKMHFSHRTTVQTYYAGMVIPEMSSQQVGLVVRMRTGWHLQ